MTILSVTWLVVRCDGCGRLAEVEGSVRRWESVEAAILEVSGARWRWVANAQTQICPACVAAHICGGRGHEWGPWQELPPACEPGEFDDLVVRVCGRCRRDEVTDRSEVDPDDGDPIVWGAAG